MNLSTCVFILIAVGVTAGYETGYVRRDCYPWPGASPAACTARGCIWDDWGDGSTACVYADGVCPSSIPENQRQDASPGVAGKPECLAAGFDWCPSTVQGVPWCFDDPDVDMGGEREPTIPESQRLDCHPEPINAEFSHNQQQPLKETCLSRDCYFWTPQGAGVPHCFTPSQQVYSMPAPATPTPRGFTAELVRNNYPSWFGNDINTVRLDVEFQTDDRLRLKFYDPSAARFEPPVTIDSPSTAASSPAYEVVFTTGSSFNVKVNRISNGVTIFDTSMGGLQFSDQFLQISTKLDSANVYGFGEHEHKRLKHDMQYKHWGMWSRDYPVVCNDDHNKFCNLYGVHPFYLNVEKSGSANAVLFLNSNAQDVTMMPAPGLTYITTGGILDIYLFLGPGPDQAIQQYLQAVGTPVMVPYWSLGFQLCRWGYHNLPTLQAAVNRMRQYNIPHDVQYGDIDYMSYEQDFTLDAENFTGLPEYVMQLKEEGTRFIIILDPGIANSISNYPPLDTGNAQDVWVKDPTGATPIRGEVWPGEVYFPDFTKQQTQDWWTDQCVAFKSTIDYDGLWIDMNEVSNWHDNVPQVCADNPWNYPPYPARLIDRDIAMHFKGLCADFTQAWGTVYDVHSLYGFSMAQQTLPAARAASPGKRSIVYSRSTFPGAGSYGQHWLGDNFSNWDNLKYSVIGMLEFNMFGFPYVGSDICGFNDVTNEELCLRWQQLGAFYTFSRNHNALGEPDQDPGIWPSVAVAARDALQIRYTLLPYLYTLFYHVHSRGGTVVRPLFFEFPSDSSALINDEQFMWGPALMVSPVLRQGQTQISAYFPVTSQWFKYSDGERMPIGHQIIAAPLDEIPLHVREGHVLPIQEPANSTLFSRQNPLGLLVALNTVGHASGDLFWDDGESLDTHLTGNYFYATFAVAAGSVQCTVVYDGYAPIGDLRLENLRLFGVNEDITNFYVNEVQHNDFVQDTDTNAYTVSNLGIIPNTDFTISWD